MSSLVVRFPRTAQAQARSRSLLADLADGWAEFCSRSAAGQRPAEQAPLPGKDDPLLARGTQVASGQRSYGASGPKVHTGVT